MLAGCGVMRLGRREPLVPVPADRLPAFDDDLELASLRAAVERTLPVYVKRGEKDRAAAARRLLEILSSTRDAGARRAAIAAAFRVVRVREPLLLTAYYEPELAGSLKRTARYRYPLYARPKDLIDVDPALIAPECNCRKMSGRMRGGHVELYPSRAEIDGGALAGRGLEIAWAADQIQLAVLHVQGSGLLRLENGRLLGVRYAGTNGRPYTSLGQTLAARGYLRGGASLPAIRAALAAMSPGERAVMLATNERYTFFRLADGGPVGSLGVPLTPGRSVATDPRLVPPGAIGWVDTGVTRRFVVGQDAGAAIVGPHADLFLGSGPAAEERAGRTRERGEMFVLLPR